MRLCTVKRCHQKYRARGMCEGHYRLTRTAYFRAYQRRRFGIPPERWRKP